MRRCCNLSLEWNALFQPATKASFSISVWIKQGKCFTSGCWGEYNSCGVHDPTRIFGVYTSILDCSKGKEKHMLGYISDDKPCGVADTHLVVSWLSETRDGWSFVLDKLLWDRKRFSRADTDWESTCRVNKSQYAHRVSDIF